MEYQYILDKIQQLIVSLYQDFHTSVISKGFTTPFIPVKRGVLQGDCISPLLFNMCFNSFIQLFKSDNYNQLGFSPVSERGTMFNPVHWCQFADDTAVITTNGKENQLLLNCVTRWCQWANMVVRVDKCSTFGVKKFSTKSLQFTPKLLINNQRISAVKIGESFRYLGRYFDYETSNKQQHHLDAKATLTDLLQQIDSLNIHPKSKLLLYQTYVLSKLSWHFTVADISKTSVIQNLDNTLSSYVRSWLDLPISATISHLTLSKSKFGLNLQLPSTKFLQCQTVLGNTLKSSPNDNIKSLWENTSS